MTPPTEQTNLQNPENMMNGSDLVVVNQEAVHHYEHSNDLEEYFRSLPLGYRFRPDDEELIIHFLANKVSNQPLPPNKIYDVDLYTKSPATLTAEYKCNGDKEWYFFTPRNRKYPQGERPNRTAGNGYWKATGGDKSIMLNKTKIGAKKALVFYEGKPPGTKTEWIMYEYTVHNPQKRKRSGAEDVKMDDWVLCKVYENPRQVMKSKRQQENYEADSNDSTPNETSLWNPNHQNHEGTLMLPNQPELWPPLWNQEQMLPAVQHNMSPDHTNQMDYCGSSYYDHNYPQHPNACETQQRLFQGGQQTNVMLDQQQGHMSQIDYSGSLYSDQGFHNYPENPNDWEAQQHPIQNGFQDEQQTNVMHDQQQGYLNQPGRNEYDIHPSSYLEFTSPPSDPESNNITFTCDNINDFNVDQFLDIGEYNFDQQQSPFVP